MPKKVLKIVLTGPESSGKSTLALKLAVQFRGVYVPEFAREFLEQINRPYTFADVELVSRKQLELVAAAAQTADLIFIDTHLVIAKIWFKRVFGKEPAWLESHLTAAEIDLYLLCAPDLPWAADPLRENPGEARKQLFAEYEQTLKTYQKNYRIIEGAGKARLEKACRIVETFLAQPDLLV